MCKNPKLKLKVKLKAFISSIDRNCQAINQPEKPFVLGWQHSEEFIQKKLFYGWKCKPGE